MTEFDIIADYFAPLTMGKSPLDNDTASIDVPAGQQLIVTTDTLNEGIHFFAGTAPEIIARKALRSNLSDLASSGAQPLCYQLAIAFDNAPDEAWLKSFTDALQEDQKAVGIYCSGGDTTSIKSGLSITITALGLAPAGGAVMRSGARAGDVAIVTGALGAGMAAFQRGETIAPPLQVRVHEIVRGYARAAVDVSDGLLADAGHIARGSSVDLYLRADDIPHDGALLQAVTGGDDYVLCMAVAAERATACLQALGGIGAQGAIIGEFRAGGGHVRLIGADGQDITPEKGGWQHFDSCHPVGTR